VMHDGGSRRTEARVITEDGQEMDIDIALIGINEQDGENAAILLSAHDITYLKELERFKTAFVANAVHDLSSPITSLGTRLYLLKKTPERLGEHVQILEDQFRHLKDLVTDLRSLSEIDRGLIVLNREPVDLNGMVTQIFQEYEAVAEDKHLHLRLLLAPDLPPVELDRRKCERIIINLIANAIHYTPPDKEIRVKTQAGDGEVIFVVEDEGIGIPKEDLPHIFERFYRADHARSTNQSGTGLGLSIVKEMISAHGGTVTVESEVNRGSTFTVHFPLEPDDRDSALA
jgi:signal transduction histidine kinase